MAYENRGKGFLMRVELKKSDRGPDYTGKIELDDGYELQVSGWVETSKSGKKYLSLSLQEHVEEEPASKVAPSQRRGTGADRRKQPDEPASDNWDDEVPF